MTVLPIHLSGEFSPATFQLLDSLRRIRQIQVVAPENANESVSNLSSKPLLQQLLCLSRILLTVEHEREAETIESVHSLAIQDTDFGGLGFEENQELTSKEEAQILFLVSAWLESLNSEDRVKSPLKMFFSRPKGRRGMTISEKIFAAHDIERRGELKPGDMVRVAVDWVMASELSWSGMKKAYDSLGKPGIFRNDRFWLAGDHVVDPRVKDNPLIKKMVSDSETAKEDFMMTEYQGMNYTIMHTEFFRERAQPGMLIIGSDSHTCSAGSLGCLAIGLGVADVTMPLITGETWFKVPESVNIQFVGKPGPGIGGKDVILYIMKELKRNTVAADRVVEYTGPGLQYLSCDARFAIANMTTEFGGITGIFTPDQVTCDFIDQRHVSRHKKTSNYFCPDEDAKYIDSYVIDLSNVKSFIALYPSPDDVVPISKVEGMNLDGCFIGACTTAEEDLILAGMVLELGLKRGLRPTKTGKRKMVPGSLPILHRLKELGFVEIYEEAGFEVGIPGCSYCVGMSADKAGKGEVWLSSQNRNFENRMGTGSFGHLGSAVSVAASSFDMKVTNPQSLMNEMDLDRLKELLNRNPKKPAKKGPVYVEPGSESVSSHGDGASTSHIQQEIPNSALTKLPEDVLNTSESSDVIFGRVQRLGDFIDTDALAPAEALITCKTNEEFGKHCLEHTHPEFRSRVKDGNNIVVAGTAFGCGSSRENAVNALLGTGVQCVIAKSFAFIYARNQPNLGLLGIVISDSNFYEAAVDGAKIEVDLTARKVKVGHGDWSFELSRMERELTKVGGITQAFEKFGKKLFEVMCAPASSGYKQDEGCGTALELRW